MRTITQPGQLGLGTVAVYAGLGVLHLLVLNPLAAVPGVGLGSIYDRVHQAGETMGVTLAVLWALVLIGLSGAAWWQVRRPGASTGTQVLMANLALVVLGAPSLFVVSFWSGMSLADTFGISGGDHAPWARVLYLVSALAALGFLWIAVMRRRSADPTASEGEDAVLFTSHEGISNSDT
ncbi:hypothetical protein [Kocuria sp. KH4]